MPTNSQCREPRRSRCRGHAGARGLVVLVALGASASALAAGVFPVTVKDKDSRSVTVTGAKSRIACMSVTCVDIMADLGLVPVAASGDGHALAADQHFFGPKVAKSIPTIRGGFVTPNIEDVIASTPDLIASQAQRYEKFTSALSAAAPVYLLGPGIYQDEFQQLRDFGAMTGRTAQAAAAIKKTRDEIAAYRAKSPRNVSALMIAGDPKGFDLETDTSAVGSLLARVTRYPWKVPPGVHEDGAGDIAYSLEKVLNDDPDVIFVESFPGTPKGQAIKPFISSPIWSKLKAVKTHRVYEVSALYATEAQATRASRVLLPQLMALLYPKLFKHGLK